ncbi:hypothetical protein GCM10010313_38070 [Streptomyces violarus]|nr:hypothetical protein GCM10010313_38070 [Streptomyces violarus]
MSPEFSLNITSDNTAEISLNGCTVLTLGYNRTRPWDTIETTLNSKCDPDFKFSDLLQTLSQLWAHQNDTFTAQHGEILTPNKSTRAYVGISLPTHGGTSVVFTQFSDSPTEIDFDIPSHPLSMSRKCDTGPRSYCFGIT